MAAQAAVPLPTAMDWSSIVASNVRAACARASLNQSQLARAIGVTPAAVNIKWRGKRQWQLEDLEAIAEVLGVTPWSLVQPTSDMQWEPSEGMENAHDRLGGNRSRALVRQKGLEPPTF